MNPDCLQHRLTDDERECFDTNGYLIVNNALAPDLHERLLQAADVVDKQERSGSLTGRLLSVPNVIHRDLSFVELVDNPLVLPKVWGILGWNIYLYHSHVDITPPAPDATAGWEVAWHQDSMRVNDDIETHPRPRLSLKIGYFLTDVSKPGYGNTQILPGSHLHDEIDCPQDGFSSPEGAVPVCAPAGSAVIIDRRVWHSRSRNSSDVVRRVVWYGYSYRWLRPKDAMTVSHLYPESDPVRRQLLGDGLSANGTYDPTPDDVPLRSWLEQYSPDDAAWTKHSRPQSRPPAMVRGHHSGRQ